MATIPGGQAAAEFIQFLQNEFPKLNEVCRDGELSLARWTEQVAPMVRDAAEVVGHVGPATGEVLLRGGGMVLQAGERLAQPLGFVPGQILAVVPGLEGMLIRLAGPNGRPALDHNGYWLRNHHPVQFTFTTAAYERFFIGSVQGQAAMRRGVHELLQLLRSGAVDPGSSLAGRLVSAAASVLEQGQAQFRDFNHGPDGKPGQTPTEFNEMRVWLTGTAVGGKSYSGPNAAYVVDMIGTDFVLGTADDRYRAYVASFVGDLSADDQAHLAAITAAPSLLDVIAKALGYAGADGLATAATAEVATRLAVSPNLLATATAARAVHRAFSGGSGAHVGLISSHLQRYGATLTPGQRAALPVDPETGVGGHGHDHTRQLHDARRSNPAWKSLIAAVRAAEQDAEPRGGVAA